MNIEDNLKGFLEEFDRQMGILGKTKEDVSLLFATKYLSSEEFVSFIDIAKQFDIDNYLIGENRVQDWEKKFSFIKEKRSDLLGSFTPVMIGTLQKNKVNKALELFTEIHSVDSLELAKAIDDRVKKGKKLPIYLEVNVSEEDRKHGFSLKDIHSALSTMKQLNNVTIQGLMTMAPNTDDENIIRRVFRTLRSLADQYNLKTSMGMSSDWKIAIEEGSDMVRVGSIIFSGHEQ